MPFLKRLNGIAKLFSGQRKSNRIAVLYDERINADNSPLSIDEWAARIAWIQGSIVLNVIEVLIYMAWIGNDAFCKRVF